MPNTPEDFVTIDQVRSLLKKRMGLAVSRGAIYHYIINKGFPQNTGIGRPRLWRLHEVTAWIEAFSRKA